MGDDTPAPIGALQVDEAKLRGHVDEVVRSSVEETLNGLLDAEADQLCRAQRYERSPERADGRAGHYERKLETKAGEVTLRVPKLRRLPFETAIMERYKRRESSVEEALVEMYLAGVSVRRVEDITEALWGTRVSSGTVSRLNQKIYRHIEAWRNRQIVGEFPYVYLDGVILKRSWAGEVKNVSVLIAIGVGTDGFRQILGVAEGEKEDLEGWRTFLCHLKRSRPQRRAADHLGRLQGAGGSGCRGVSQDGLAALRGPLLSQRVQPRAQRQSRRSGAHAQGDPRPGRSPGSQEQSQRDRGAVEGAETADCGRAGGAEGRGDDDLLCLSVDPLATDPDQQSAGKNHSRDPKTNSSGRGIP